jgi:DNA-binding NarL/FixJ family response regulator
MSRPSVLFVDDEPSILDGLRRSLRGKRGEWGMSFATGGAQALELLTQSPCDVVVSDMRMPGMDGAELLTLVGERHPQVGRVVLSGHIEPAATIRVAFAGHRFLTKPSRVEEVVAVIEQMLARTSKDHDSAARRIAGGVHAIPTLPAHAGRILAFLGPDVDLSLAAWTAMHDVGLTAKLLQLSNSRFFGSRPRNSSVESIAHSMGLAMVQAVVGAAYALQPATPWTPEVERHLEASWRHAVATARLVEVVASPANWPHAQAAALLQDVGRLICLAPAADDHASIDLAAQTRDGIPFRDVGVELLHLWGLHPPIIAAVAHRDTPQCPDVSGLGVAASVRTAHLLIQETESACPGAPTGGEELAQLLSHPQLRAQDVDWREAADEASRYAHRWGDNRR